MSHEGGAGVDVGLQLHKVETHDVTVFLVRMRTKQESGLGNASVIHAEEQFSPATIGGDFSSHLEGRPEIG